MTRPLTIADFVADGFRTMHERNAALAWPAPQWFDDPEGFAWTILGVTLWRRQVEILEGLRDNDRVSVVGGRKIGKDFLAGVASCWWYGSVPGGRVFLTAPTGKQVDGILYRQIRILIAGSGRCVECKAHDAEKIARGIQPDPPPCPHSSILANPSEVGKRAHTGVVAPDMREMKGVTADKAEGIQGWSGRILAIPDEASGIEDAIHHAIRGNLAAEGCKELAIGNGTRSTGWFYESHHGKAASLYKRFAVSSLDTPNYIEGREVFPGLASRAWVDECKEEWGEDSALYKVHVLGQFVQNEAGAIFSVHAISMAVLRWDDAADDGPLSIGVDPAGEEGDGDESGFAPARGDKIYEIAAKRGLSPEAHVLEVLAFITKYKRAGDSEKARVILDALGDVGSKVRGAFVAYMQAHGDACPFELVTVRSSDKAKREKFVYDRVRDELAANFATWLRRGGAIPQDAKLSKDLSVFRWRDIAGGLGLSKVIEKTEMKKILGRSPDRADACMLAVWRARQIGATTEAAAREEKPAPPDPFVEAEKAEKTFDSVSALEAFRY